MSNEFVAAAVPSLNIDLGEYPGEPPELYRLATVVNIACGGHAGDAASMARAIELARDAGASIAAHPSYPDRAGFGRRTLAMPPSELGASIASQCRALREIAARHGLTLNMVKPHGALYHDLSRDPALADAVIDAAARALERDPADLAFVGPPGSPLSVRVRLIAEGFADRGYDGETLLPRGAPGALIEDAGAAAEQALALVRSGAVQTICVHGDTPNAVAIARAVRAALDGWSP